MTVLKYMLDAGAFAPEYAHEEDAGMDLRTPTNVAIMPGLWITLDLKIHFFVDPGFYLAIVPKSGLASRKGLSIVNTPATIDAGYTGNVQVILINNSKQVIEFVKGDKVCQAILKKKESVELVQVFEKPVTERQDGGFGSTGV